jgi:hypothetical protein
MKKLLSKFLMLISSVSFGQGQKTLQKNKADDPTSYFTVINWIYLANTNPNEKDLKIEEDDLEPGGNYQSANKYFQNILFFSTKPKQQILFEIFLTVNKEIRKKEFFKNADSISSFFHQKYEVGFFYDSEYEKGKKFERSFSNLERHITFEDFKKIVVNNFTIDLVKTIELSECIQKAPYTLAYNWDFFEETAVSPKGMNMLLRNIHSLPVGKTLHSDKKWDLQFASLCNLDIWSYYPDSKLKGIVFSETDLKKYKCSDLKISFCSCFKTPNEYIIEPNTRDFRELYKSQYQNDNARFSKDYQLMLDFFNQKMRPFNIWDNKTIQ